MPKYDYHGTIYDIDNLKRNKFGALTKTSQRVFKSYQRNQSKSPTCKGFLNQICNKSPNRSIQGLCGSCYNKQYHTRFSNEFISQITGIENIQISSLNPNVYSNVNCIEKDCTSRTGISYPYCQKCLSTIHHLRVGISNIPGSGLGLFCDQDLPKGHRFSMQFGSKQLDLEEFKRLKSQTDDISLFRSKFLIQIRKDSYIDASDEKGGVLRFINNSLSKNLTNCKLYVYKDQVRVRTIKDIGAGCELFIIYNHSQKFPFQPKLLTEPAVKQQQEILENLRIQ
ncbi:hypothetical protein BC833DRAFT_609440 [Globomyces pollinis-pini]|nr:hypothetical protein BC833DRAFT_609440 [Globomyces pollinis-pini]KAJ2991719.1 hypothetical protein HDV02_003514 [Globomyces sp. JEL0801]